MTISTPTASQETSRQEPSPRTAPRISNAIAAVARSISGNAGERTGRPSSGMRLGLIEARAAQTRGFGRGVYLLHQVIDRDLDRPQERTRIDAHPQHEHEQRGEHRFFTRAQIQDISQIGTRYRAENDSPVEIEHVGRPKEQRGGCESALEGADLESAEQNKELADKPARPGESDRRQSEHHEDEGIGGHAFDKAAKTRDLVRMQPVVEDADTQKQRSRDQ